MARPTFEAVFTAGIMRKKPSDMKHKPIPLTVPASGVCSDMSTGMVN